MIDIAIKNSTKTFEVTPFFFAIKTSINRNSRPKKTPETIESQAFRIFGPLSEDPN